MLWARHASRLLAFARAIVGPHDADDAVQAVFCGLLDLPRKRLSEIRDVPSFLAASTRRAALNLLRSTRRERERRRAGRSPVAGSTATVENDLTAALDALPRRQREVVVLKHVAGLTFDQIAVALNLPRDTAASRYRAAIAALRRVLEGAGARGVRLETAHA